MAITVKVSGQYRVISRFIAKKMIGPKPPVGFECDGCTKSPDTILGCPVWIACVWHDVPYPDMFNALGVTRSQVDFWLYRNIFTIMNIYLGMRLRWKRNWIRLPVCAFVALTYGTVVNFIGGVSGWRRWIRIAIMMALLLGFVSLLVLGLLSLIS